MTAETESLLLARAQSGEVDAFAELYSAHYARLLSWIRRMGLIEEDAEDLAQDTFMLAFQKVRGFRGESRLLTWLCVIARNLFLMNRRRSASEQRVYVEDLSQFALAETLLDELITQNLIDQSLQGLRGRQKQMVALYLEGKTMREIACAHDCPEGTCKAILFRSKAKMRRVLDRSLRPQSPLASMAVS